MINRYASTLLIVLFPLGVWAQKLVIQDSKLNGILPINGQGKVVYLSVQTIDGISKEQLLDRARNWALAAYSETKDVLPVINMTTGQVLGKGKFVVHPPRLGVLVPTRINYKLVIVIQAGQYQATLSGFSLKAEKTTKPIESLIGSPAFIEQTYVQTDEQARALLLSLAKAMSTPTANF